VPPSFHRIALTCALPHTSQQPTFACAIFLCFACNPQTVRILFLFDTHPAVLTCALPHTLLQPTSCTCPPLYTLHEKYALLAHCVTCTCSPAVPTYILPHTLLQPTLGCLPAVLTYTLPHTLLQTTLRCLPAVPTYTLPHTLLQPTLGCLPAVPTYTLPHTLLQPPSDAPCCANIYSPSHTTADHSRMPLSPPAVPPSSKGATGRGDTCNGIGGNNTTATALKVEKEKSSGPPFSSTANTNLLVPRGFILLCSMLQVGLFRERCRLATAHGRSRGMHEVEIVFNCDRAALIRQKN
jgi:hypothetical protein